MPNYMIKQTSCYTVLPPTPLSQFMSAIFDIEDAEEAFMQVNIVNHKPLGKVKIADVLEILGADSGLERTLNVMSSEDYIIWGIMYNKEILGDIEDMFWDMVHEVEDYHTDGIIDEITSKETVGEISEKLSIPEFMFRHVFRSLSFSMCGGSAPNMPYINKEGYFVFPSPIRTEEDL
ncbi:MAG: hypothetical protein OXU27_06205 [Candidatus Poribacteria bacterium]|nr:hypothetical protein [Candidatus Poribacteria bacterium]